MIRRTRVASALIALLAACGERPGTHAEVPAIPAAPRRPADSLLLTTRLGAQVWFVAGRPATDSSGTPCTERTMQIRWSGKSTPIPLLYTGSAPRLVNDTTIEAAIWLHCRPGNVYRVNLRTGLPVRVK